MKLHEAKLIRVSSAIPETKPGNVEFNVSKIINIIRETQSDLIVFPELSVTGYTCGDLFGSSLLIQAASEGLMRIQESLYEIRDRHPIIIVGAPIVNKGKLMNSAIILQGGDIKGIIHKKFLPGYKEFYEPRWFYPGNDEKIIFKTPDFNMGVEICEDVWSPNPPSTELYLGGADIVVNLSASPELVGKHQYLRDLIKQQSARCIGAYVYSGAGFGESSTDLVYGGPGFIVENGKILAETERWKTEGQVITYDIDIEEIRGQRRVNTSWRPTEEVKEIKLIETGDIEGNTIRSYTPNPFASSNPKEIMEIQALGLAKRLKHTGMRPVIGVSGGSDSTWALLVTLEAIKKLGRTPDNILGVTMPGFATSERTLRNSKRLMELLGITWRKISIVEISKEGLKALGHPENLEDITYENVQARDRTEILMNLANQEGGLVIGTGDLSELALGWCTYNADHMSMYGVNSGVPKTLIKQLISWYLSKNPDLEEVLLDILSTPVSPELTGTGATGDNQQISEDKIGPYELHDFFLYHMIHSGFGPKKIMYMARIAFGDKYDIKKWMEVFLKRFFSQQFKRSCLPDGPKIGSISLSPRGDWRMPSDAIVSEWLKEL